MRNNRILQAVPKDGALHPRNKHGGMIALQHQIVHSWASAQRSICQITGEAPVASHTHWMPRSGQQPPRQLNQLCFSFCANCLYHALHLGVARCSLYVLTLGDSVQGFATAVCHSHCAFTVEAATSDIVEHTHALRCCDRSSSGGCQGGFGRWKCLEDVFS